jgi:CRISPR/Cas system-associated endonuclease Cas3-HD
MKNDLLRGIEDYIFNYYKDNGPAENVYHNLFHVRNVVGLVKEIGKYQNIDKSDLEIVKIAAWFHDIGHIDCWDDHEEISADHATGYLQKIEYPKEKIDKVYSCILATKIPHQPKDLWEEIICDADIAHIGLDSFGDQSELLKLEIEKRVGKKLTDFKWLEKNIEFLSKNKFFTKYGKDKLDGKKNENLIKLKRQHQKKLEKKKDKAEKKERFVFEKEKLASKSIDSKKSDRGIETMFRNVIRTHVSFSSMADSKANIMISVNTILLGAIFTILARKLDTNPHLVIPTIMLTFVSLTTLILAVSVTRPSVSSGLFTKDDIKNKLTNLLFFGNFYKMKLDDFAWGMNEMMEDKEFLYDSMIKDFYYLGQVLGRKYKILRVCYTVFMIGITLAVLLFVYFIWTTPTNVELHDLIE